MLSNTGQINTGNDSLIQLPKPTQSSHQDNKMPLIDHDSSPSAKVTSLMKRFSANLQVVIRKLSSRSPEDSSNLSSPSMYSLNSEEKSREERPELALEMANFRRPSKSQFANLHQDRNPKYIHRKSKDLDENEYDLTRIRIDSNISESSNYDGYEIYGMGYNPMGLSSKRQFQVRSRGWKLVRAVVTIISLAKRNQEEYEDKINTIMKGKELEEEALRNEKRFYISPKSNKKTAWDIIISMSLIYYALIVPLRWSEGVTSSTWLAIDIFLDLMIWTDIFFSFFTGIALGKFLIKDRKMIAKRYLKKYFFWDLVSALPLYWINFDFYFLKFLRLVHLKRAFLLFKRCFLVVPKGVAILKLLQGLFLFLCALNTLNAIWIYLGRIYYDEGSWIEGLNLTLPQNLSDAIDLYILGDTFVVTTVTTIGYGDVKPKQPSEMLILMLYEFAGVIITALLEGRFAFLLTNRIKSFVKNENMKFDDWLLTRLRLREHVKNETASLNKETRVLLQNIQNYFKYVNKFSFRALTLKNSFYRHISAPLQTQLAMSAFASFFSEFNCFFQFFYDNDFKKEIVSQLRAEIISSNQSICKAETVPKGLYFLLKGKGYLAYKGIKLFEVKEGFYFGDFLVLDANCLLDFVAGDDFVHCLYVPRKEVMEICFRYPESLKIMQNISFQRADYLQTAILKQEKHEGIKESILSMATLGEADQNDSPLNRDRNFSKTSFAELVQDTEHDSNRMMTRFITSEDFRRLSFRGEHDVSPGLLLHRLSMMENDLSPSIVSPNGLSPSRRSPDKESPELSPEFSPEISFAISPTVSKARGSILIPNLHPYSPETFSPTIVKPKKVRYNDNSDDIITKLGEKPIEPAYKKNESAICDGNSFPIQEEENDEDEQNKWEGSEDSDDENDLDNSLEVPIENDMLDFNGTDEIDEVVEYIENRVYAIDLRLKRIENIYREELFQQWKHLKDFIRKSKILKRS